MKETRKIVVGEVPDAEMRETIAAYSARLRGAARVYSVDAIPERLDKAGELGAIPINFLREDPVELIRQHQSRWRSGPAFRMENSVCEVTCAIYAIGFQARSQTDYAKEDPLWVIEAIAELIHPAGRVAIIGVWPTADPNGSAVASRRQTRCPLGQAVQQECLDQNGPRR